MAAWALTEYRFRGNTLIGLYIAIGIMVPIRLGSVSILRMMVDLNLVNTLTALDPRLHGAWAAARHPHPRRVHPADPEGPARRGALRRGQRIPDLLVGIILPLIRPAIATVAVFTMVPIWNDLWFPLILAPGDGKQTITLGVQQFIGQYVTDWNAVLASLTLAIAPILVLYLLFSRYLVRGLTAGAVK